jgi:hypothetical protein
MNAEAAVLSAEQSFFSALVSADTSALERLLAGEFVIIDVMRGAEFSKNDLVGAIAAGMVRFTAIERVESRVRFYGEAAVVTGRTRMSMEFGLDAVTVNSRYTHVFVQQDGAWRFVSAQGTQIVE